MPHRIIQARIVGGVKPYQLIAALMEQQKLRVSKLAKNMGKPKLQPSLHRYVAGEVSEPSRSTAEPLAAYFALPVDAIYKETVASTIAKQRSLSVVDWPPKTVRAKRSSAPDAKVAALATQVLGLTAQQREALLLQLGLNADNPAPSEKRQANGRP